jgi:hypothetical protein
MADVEYGYKCRSRRITCFDEVPGCNTSLGCMYLEEQLQVALSELNSMRFFTTKVFLYFSLVQGIVFGLLKFLSFTYFQSHVFLYRIKLFVYFSFRMQLFLHTNCITALLIFYYILNLLG